MIHNEHNKLPEAKPTVSEDYEIVIPYETAKAFLTGSPDEHWQAELEIKALILAERVRRGH